MNIKLMMQQAQKLQNQMTKKMEEFNKKIFEHKYKDFVEIKIKGSLEIEQISINPNIVDPEDVDMLNDIILAAINEATAFVKSEKDKITSSLGAGIPGLF